jgi:hypothetical protein
MVHAAAPCCTMLHHAIPCHAMPCHAMPSDLHAVPRRRRRGWLQFVLKISRFENVFLFPSLPENEASRSGEEELVQYYSKVNGQKLLFKREF